MLDQCFPEVEVPLPGKRAKIKGVGEDKMDGRREQEGKKGGRQHDFTRVDTRLTRQIPAKQ